MDRQCSGAEKDATTQSIQRHPRRKKDFSRIDGKVFRPRDDAWGAVYVILLGVLLFYHRPLNG